MSAKVQLQIDVGFGDAITPGPENVEFPALLDFPAPRLRGYPRETVIAEKLEAMVQLGIANTRMKDFFDLVTLSQMFEFDGAMLARAITATFDRRATPIPRGRPVAFTPEFSNDATKRVQWIAFLRKSNAVLDVGDLPAAVASTLAFLGEPLDAVSKRQHWAAQWSPGGPWRGK